MPEINIINDGTFDIALGRDRQTKNWKNREMLWSTLVQKLSVTHYTAETHAEYMAAKKSRQDEIKDIGGFVGGYLTGGRRKSGSVMHRQLVTLDIDFATQDIWDDFTLLYGNAAAIYSTHKHSPESPRLRLILPLDRQVFPDEYMAISRRIAGILGIDYFDHTTFQPSRLMYWPSTSKDGAFMFDYQDGDWLSADEILATYHDWKDTSEWPVSSREQNVIGQAAKKQGDPTEKPGIVGAWCRTYSITDVIELFLDDVYESCDVEGRFTYKEGSTSGGLVLYEDKYAFSHHGTDPISGKLCNSFDLVRLHKYGLKDEDTKEGTPGNKLPSYLAMTEFATKDVKVRKQLGTERLQDAKGDFDNVDFDEAEEGNDDWLGEMDVDRKGHYHATINNIVTILANDPNLKGCFALNAFEKREVALRNLPWRKITPVTKYLVDTDDASLRHYLEATYNITGIQKVKDALDITVSNNSFHPVKDYLQSLKWDGRDRLDRLLVDYLGAKDCRYTHAVTRKAFTAAVARIFQPGIKFDHVLVTVGPQGKGKSYLIDKMGKEWYSDSLGTIQGKEAFEQIQGVWLVEVAELAGLKKADIETIKHFMSKREDRYRVAFGRRVENFPRQCAFFGTSNNLNFLRDPSGNRRFWPVDIHEIKPIKNIFTELTNEVINQLWAEAIVRYKAGEPLFLSAEVEEEAKQVQRDHSEVDERAGIIQKYLDTKLPVDWDDYDVFKRREFLRGDELQPEGTIVRDRVCIAEIWCELFGGMQKDMTTHNTKDLHSIMQTLEDWSEGSTGKLRFKIYGPQKAYVRLSGNHKSTLINTKKVFHKEKIGGTNGS